MVPEADARNPSPCSLQMPAGAGSRTHGRTVRRTQAPRRHKRSRRVVHIDDRRRLRPASRHDAYPIQYPRRRRQARSGYCQRQRRGCKLGRTDTHAGPTQPNPTPSVRPCIRPRVCRDPRWPQAERRWGSGGGTKPNTNQPNPPAKRLRTSQQSSRGRADWPLARRGHINIVVLALGVVYAMVEW
jgi:hypothetical protein